MQLSDHELEIWFTTKRNPFKLSKFKIVLDLHDPMRIGFTVFTGSLDVAQGGVDRNDGEFRGNCNPGFLTRDDAFTICDAVMKLSIEEATTLH